MFELLTFGICSLHDPDAIKAAGDAAFVCDKEFCARCVDGNIKDAPP